MTAWRHLAHSIESIDADGRYSFSVAGAVSGARLELSDGDGLRRHGIHFQGGIAQAVENGVRVGPAWPFSTSDRWHLVRFGRAVYYCRSPQPPGNEQQARACAFWFSRVPCAGRMTLHADLLAPQDAVIEAQKEAFFASAPHPLPPALSGASVRAGLRVAASGTQIDGGSARLKTMVWARAIQPPHLAAALVFAPQLQARAIGASVQLRFSVAMNALAPSASSHAGLQLAAGARAGGAALQASHWASAGALSGDSAQAVANVVLEAKAGALVGCGADSRAALHLGGGSHIGSGFVVRSGAMLGCGAKAAGNFAASDAARADAGARARSDAFVMLGASLAAGARAAGSAAALQNVAAACTVKAIDACRASAMLPRLISCGARAIDAVRATPAACSAASGAIAADACIMREPGVVAWAMNAETGAVSWWSNWQFADAVQLPDGRVFAVGPAGVSEWCGDLDAGEAVHAHVRWGLLEFGGHGEDGSPLASEAKKRITQVTVGYHAKWKLATSLHAFGEGQRAAVFEMPPQVEGRALSHVNHRMIPAKGLCARYWRLQLSGRGPWQAHSVTVDVAASRRRL